MPVTADPHAGAPLQVRNEIRKTKLLMKQEKMLEQELSTLQKEIDDLVRNAQCYLHISSRIARRSSKS